MDDSSYDNTPFFRSTLSSKIKKRVLGCEVMVEFPSSRDFSSCSITTLDSFCFQDGFGFFGIAKIKPVLRHIGRSSSDSERAVEVG
ncbi:hypothetical protein Bca4012_077923 [Brassica carinata]|uniref:Uncharacterized protein n=1 Tax=Brassica carinata TaxID=52824 RepID=A0A8X7U3I2_BRACI|nr:hypothetical protein Bca52824_071964 [Brassica carinata]